jgi:hypothetical protein
MIEILKGLANDYAWQIILAELIFMIKLPHRYEKFFPWQIVLSTLVGIGFSFLSFRLGLYSLPFYFIVLFFLFLWAYSGVVAYFACSIDVKSAIYIAIAGYCVQNVYFNLKGAIAAAFSIETFSPLYFVVYFLALFIVYGGAYFLFAHKKIDRQISIATWQLVLLGTAVIIIACVCSTYCSSIDLQTPVVNIVIAACCLLTLFIMFGLFEQGELRKENEVLLSVLHKEEENYRISQDTIELINIKCHDLKKQISQLRYLENTEKSDSIREIEKSVMIYESIAKTDNQALDLVLTEKSLLCEKYHIQFSYIADGKLLDFMSLVDIYSLFGNALDNAIEALLKEEEDKRIIQMNIRARGKLLYIDIDNYSSRKMEFQDGLPVTDKEDKDYHGFGLKSIRYITEKYDGAFSVMQKNDMFLLHLLFSIPSA